MLKEIFFPLKAIKTAKKTKNVTTQLITLAIASVITSIALALILTKMNSPFNVLNTLLLAIPILFLGGMAKSLIYSFTLKIMSAKGKFFDSLTAVTQSTMVMSAGLLLTSLVIMIPEAGMILGMIVLFLGLLTAYTVFFRAMTDMTGATLLQIITMIIILFVALIIATQVISMIELMSAFSEGGLDPSMMGQGAFDQGMMY